MSADYGGFDFFFSGRIWDGEHAALVLGWGDDQLIPVVEALAPYLAGDLTSVLSTGEPTPNMRRAVAAVARSLVADTHLTGQPLRYSRDRDYYGGAKRYKRDRRYHSFHYITRAVELLVLCGLADHRVGEWFGPGSRGRQSVVWPTEELLELLGPVIDAREPRGELHDAEVIVLRDRKNKRDVDYEETAATTAMRAEVRVLNAELAKLELYLDGEPFPIPLARRVFTGNFDHGGRLYCLGASFQNIHSDRRPYLQIRTGGALRPTSELDFATLHIAMAYALAGQPMPPGDQYDINGFPRELVKRAVNILLNAATRHGAVSAIVEELHHRDPALWRRTGQPTSCRKDCWPVAKAVVEAVEAKHSRIAQFFGSDCGLRFQRRDSDMAVRVMNRMIARTGRCPLALHDSFIVADIDREVLAQTMLEVASEEGLALCVKESWGQRRWGPVAPPGPRSGAHLGETTPELDR